MYMFAYFSGSLTPVCSTFYCYDVRYQQMMIVAFVSACSFSFYKVRFKEANSFPLPHLKEGMGSLSFHVTPVSPKSLVIVWQIYYS